MPDYVISTNKTVVPVANVIFPHPLREIAVFITVDPFSDYPKILPAQATQDCTCALSYLLQLETALSQIKALIGATRGRKQHIYRINHLIFYGHRQARKLLVKPIYHQNLLHWYCMLYNPDEIIQKK